MIHLWSAHDLTEVGQRLEPDEVLSVVQLPFEEALERVHRGDITDAKTICALTLAWQNQCT